VLSEKLCKYAQNWADHMAKTHKFDHSQCRLDDGAHLGENIYMSGGEYKDGEATKAWYA
jgi:uncharacterized protein YkwD